MPAQMDDHRWALTALGQPLMRLSRDHGLLWRAATATSFPWAATRRPSAQ